MKRLNKILILILLVVTVFALASCDDKPQPKQLPDVVPELEANQMAVIIKNGEGDYEVYTVTLGANGVEAETCEDVLAYLKDNQQLSLTWSDSDYGKFVSAIGGINPNASNEYVQVFTSNADYQGTWAGVTVYEINENLALKDASVGVSYLGVAAGDIVYFELGSF